MGLKPWEFERLTIREFEILTDAYIEHQKREDRKTAFITALLLSPYADDMNNLYNSVYYGLHPEEKPSPEEEKKAFIEQFDL